MEYILLMIGFIFLIKGADLFVEGSCNLARFLKVPSVIIGLTIVAMGTSAPEASVSIRAAFTGNNEIALSNIIGSNIFNGLIVVGICAFLASFKTDKTILKKDLPFNIIGRKTGITELFSHNHQSLIQNSRYSLKSLVLFL